jgi:hypothetical protein
MPGDGAGLGGTTVAADPELGGVVQTGGDLVIPFQIFGAGDALLYEASLQTRVIISSDTGNAHFLYRIRDVNGSLNGVISEVVASDYSGMQTRVEYGLDSAGDVGPSRAERSADGADISYLFGNGFPAGEESHFFFAVTDQSSWSLTGSTTITLTTGESVTLTTFIPAPGGAGLFAAAGLMLARRRRD